MRYCITVQMDCIYFGICIKSKYEVEYLKLNNNHNEVKVSFFEAHEKQHF